MPDMSSSFSSSSLSNSTTLPVGCPDVVAADDPPNGGSAKSTRSCNFPKLRMASLLQCFTNTSTLEPKACHSRNKCPRRIRATYKGLALYPPPCSNRRVEPYSPSKRVKAMNFRRRIFQAEPFLPWVPPPTPFRCTMALSTPDPPTPLPPRFWPRLRPSRWPAMARRIISAIIRAMSSSAYNSQALHRMITKITIPRTTHPPALKAIGPRPEGVINVHLLDFTLQTFILCLPLISCMR